MVGIAAGTVQVQILDGGGGASDRSQAPPGPGDAPALVRAHAGRGVPRAGSGRIAPAAAVEVQHSPFSLPLPAHATSLDMEQYLVSD